MFWRFGFNNPSAIDGLLEQEDVTLEEILNDQDIIQEAKSQNPKLIEFLLKKENIAHLIALFFSLDIDKQKLPLIACEILACEIPQLIDAIIIENVDLLEDFWNFLNMPYSSDATYAFQSSYFCKIITIFLTKRTLEMLDFIKSTPANLEKILSHLQSSAIMDLLLTLVRLEELPEAKGIVQWLNDNGLLLNLINRLDPNLDTDEHCTAQQCICEIVRMSQTSLLESPSIGINDFTIQLTSKETMQKLVNFMLDTNAPNSTSTLINGVTIIIDIIRHNNSDMDNEAAVAMGYQNQLVRPNIISLIDMLQVLTDNIEKFNNILLHPKPAADVTFRESLPVPLGFERLKICELFAELLHCSNMSSLNVASEETQPENQTKPTTGDLLKLEFVKHRVLPTCTDLFFSFPLNNFLHYVVYDMLHQVFNGQMGRESNRQLALSIFTQGHLTDKIVEAQEKNDIACSKPKGMRLGYMGHLTFISDEIIKLFEGYPESIVAVVKDSIDLDKWNSYCAKQLKETKERDCLPLGEVRSNGMHAIVNDDEDDDDDDDVEDDDDELDDEEEAENAEIMLREQVGHFNHLVSPVEVIDDIEEHGEWVAGSSEEFPVTGNNAFSDNNDTSAGLELSQRHVDGFDKDDDLHDTNKDGKNEAHTHVDWSGGFSDSFTPQPSTQTQNYSHAFGGEDEDDEDPFGDFNSSSDQETSHQWEEGFSSNFADMDVSTYKNQESKKDLPVKA